MHNLTKDISLPQLVRKLALFLVLVLVFEGLLIAVAPRFHSGSVLRIAKDSLLLRVGKDSSYYMAQGDLAWQQHPNALYETVFFQRGVRFILSANIAFAVSSMAGRRLDTHSSVGFHERDVTAGAAWIDGRRR